MKLSVRVALNRETRILSQTFLSEIAVIPSIDNSTCAPGFGSEPASCLLRTHDCPFHRATTGTRTLVEPAPQTSFLEIALALPSRYPWKPRCVQVCPCRCQVPVPGAT